VFLEYNDDFIHGFLVQDLAGPLLNVLEGLEQLRNAAKVCSINIICYNAAESNENQQLDR